MSSGGDPLQLPIAQPINVFIILVGPILFNKGLVGGGGYKTGGGGE